MADLTTEKSLENIDDLRYASLWRLTGGIPQNELKTILQEASDCEVALEKEIALLEAAANGKGPITAMNSSIGSGTGASSDSRNSNSQSASAGGTTTTGDAADGSGRVSTTSGSSSGGGATNGGTNDAISNRNASTANTNNNTTGNANSTSFTISALPREYDATSTSGPNYLSSAKDILATELTPLDRYFTVSSLLGRLRDPLDTPLIPQLNSINHQHHINTINPQTGTMTFEIDDTAIGTTTNNNSNNKKKNKSSNAIHQNRQKVIRQYKRVILLKQLNEIYTQPQADNTALLALVKRISNHRTAAVFRRAVNPKEAPGYEERIPFPVDMALIKKFVLCGHIQTFERLHEYIGMICHNCVKFNGRYSDYAMLTKDFESYVDDSFLDFMQKQKDKALNLANRATKK